MYIIKSIIKNKHRIVGYVCKLDNGEQIVVNKDKMIKLIINKEVTGCSIQVYKGQVIVRIKDRSKITDVQYSDLYKNKSNHELAKEYMRKQKLLGDRRLVIRLLDSDRVKLSYIRDKAGMKRIVIPKFITDVSDGILNESNVEEVKVEGYIKDLCGLCSNIKSSRLKVELKHPEVVENISYLFDGCKNVRVIELKNFKLYKVKDMSGLFNECVVLEDIIGLSDIEVRDVVDIGEMFNNCCRLRRIDISMLDTRKVRSISKLCNGCGRLKDIKLSKELGSVRSMRDAFNYCLELEYIDLSGVKLNKLEDMSFVFNACRKLKGIKMGGLNTSKVRDVRGMFANCSSLEYIDINVLDTRNVVDMSRMFKGCSSLRGIDISRLNTSKVENMAGMFEDCSSLVDVKLNGIDTRNINNMAYIFKGCKKLRSIDFGCLRLDKLENISYGFNGCKVLKCIDISNIWNIKDNKNININGLCEGCIGLERVKMSNLGFNGMKNSNGVFRGCNKLKIGGVEYV